MSSAIRDSLRRICIAAAHLWFSQSYLDRHPEGEFQPGTFTAWVYARDLEWGAELLRGRRVRVTISVEEDPS
jgi:hypothetical protein